MQEQIEKEKEKPGEKRNKFVPVSGERVLNPLPHCGSLGQNKGRSKKKRRESTEVKQRGRESGIG